MATDGNFSDIGAYKDIIASQPDSSIELTSVCDDETCTVKASSAASSSSANQVQVQVQLQRKPLLLSLVLTSSGKALLREAAPLQWNTTSSWQTTTLDGTSDGDEGLWNSPTSHALNLFLLTLRLP